MANARYDSDAEFDAAQTEIRHQAELTHRAHPEGVEEGYKVSCPICFEDYVDDMVWGTYYPDPYNPNEAQP